MAKYIYGATKGQFVVDLVSNQLIPKMIIGAGRNHIGNSPAEIRSWESNVDKIRNLLDLSNVPDSTYTYIVFEYSVIGGRIDCMFFGEGTNNKKNIIHLELKQWSNSTVHEVYGNGVIEALTGGNYRLVLHPSVQVEKYQKHLLNFVELFENDNYALTGYAYCYNYNSTQNPNDLYAEQYNNILSDYPTFSGNQINILAGHLHNMLCKGNGEKIFEDLKKSKIRPTKNLIDAVANMFKGHDEFTLLDDQLVSSRTIFGEIEKKVKNKDDKTVIIIKGGPGTGKSVIALHVLAALAQKGHRDIYYTTRSTALRDSLRKKLKDISLKNGQKNSADDIIKSIFDFRPAYYKENETDVILVDEAHRLQKKSNFMSDDPRAHNCLSQDLTIMYCSKVSVFFIDDHQNIESKEIGLSSKIKESAKNYKDLLKKQCDTFEKEYNKILAAYQKKQSELEQLKKSFADYSPQEYQLLCLHQQVQ